MDKKILLVGLFALCIFLYKPNNAVDKNHAHEKEDFVVGVALGYLPFVGLDIHGYYEGFDIDVAKVLAERMNKKLVFKDCGSMSSLFVSLEQGLIHAIMWGLSITESRLQKVAMVRYYGDDVQSYPLVFWNHSIQSIASLDDCRNLVVCVEAGSVQEKILDAYPTIKKIYVDRIDDALFNIQYKKADAAFVELAIAKKFKAMFPDSISIIEIPLQKVDCEFGVGIAINQNDEELIHALECAVYDLRINGTLDRCAKKWGL
jgi:ABC-type amino acid transport substrate-binding protein